MSLKERFFRRSEHYIKCMACSRENENAKYSGNYKASKALFKKQVTRLQAVCGLLPNFCLQGATLMSVHDNQMCYLCSLMMPASRSLHRLPALKALKIKEDAKAKLVMIITSMLMIDPNSSIASTLL